MVGMPKLREGIFDMSTFASKLTAKIKLETALTLARDLQQERDSDPYIFTRMVDHSGKQVVTQPIVIKNIRRLMSEAIGYYPVTCRYLEKWLSDFTIV